MPFSVNTSIYRLFALVVCYHCLSNYIELLCFFLPFSLPLPKPSVKKGKFWRFLLPFSFYLKPKKGKFMATATALLRKDHKLKDGSFPIAIRVISQNKNRYISLGESAFEDQWSDGLVNTKHKDEVRVNRKIRKALFEIQDLIDEYRQKRIEPTVDDLVKEKKKITSVDFFKIGEEKRCAYLKSGQQGTYIIWKPVLNKFKEHTGTPLPMDRITADLLLEYKKSLIERGNKPNTIAANFKILRKVYNEGIKGGFVPAENPFDNLENHTEDSFKDRLTSDEIKTIEDLIIDGTPARSNARDLFLFSFYCWGMRFRDVCLLTNENIKGKTLSYLTSKSNFTKRITLVMNDKSIAIIERYKKDNINYLFPFLKFDYVTKDPTPLHSLHKVNPLKFEAIIASGNTVVNDCLKKIALKAKIDKDITFHTARHSFVDITKKAGVSIEMRMQMVGHTSEKIHKKYHGDFDPEGMSKMVSDIIG